MREEFLALLKEVTPLFSNLQEESRQEIVALLMDKGPMSVAEITQHVSLSRPAVSHHLKQLLQADLVVVEKRGKERIYAVNLPCIKDKLRQFNQFFHQEAE